MAEPLEFGLDTFGDVTVDAEGKRLSGAEVIRNVVEEAVLADRVGVDAFGIGEHHRDDFAVTAPETVLAAIANSPVYGGGMKIAPQAKMDDGLLDICVVGAVGRVKLLCMFPSVYGGRHLKMREVEYFQAGRVRVETEHPVEIYADGEYVCRTPVEISIERGALQVIGPV